MHQMIHQHRIAASAISLGFMTVFLSLVQPIPPVSAQQLIRPINQDTGGTATQGQRIENGAGGHRYSTKPAEKMDSQTSTHKSHRLIRKPQNLPLASVEPSLSDSSSVNSVPSPPLSLQSDRTTSQSVDPSVPRRSIGAAVPLAPISVIPSAAPPTGFTATGTVPAGTIPLAAAGVGSPASSGRGGSGGRSMRGISAEMSGLAQLVSPPTAPTLSGGPAIGMNPTSLSFTAQEGEGSSATQTLTINNTGQGTLNWTASDSAAWLSLSPASGTGAGAVTASVVAGTLPPGSYSETITLSATGAPSVTVPVAFTVTAAPVPSAMRISPPSLSFTAQQGSSNPAAQTLAISNTGGGTLPWSVSHDATWLSHTPGTGTGTGTVTISVTTGTLTAGTHNGVVTLYATGAPSVTVPVAFTITPGATTASTTINVNPSSLSYAATQGAANPVNQNISLTNTDGTLNWTVTDDASWLVVSPASGTGSKTLTTSINTAGLTAKTYNGTLTVSAGTSSKTVAVTLTVNAPATSSATLTWSANTESDLAGYKIYRATTSGGYGAPVATLQGNVTTYIAAGLQSGTTYFFVVTAYDLSGNESPRSNEISRSIF